ncbi:hypothetical protein HJD18_13615 [Thermoleophilia bacterium SCSIO 60948]|nr:hypothetical protein HJD18_13615 [Thermoleophilia bacterium SCSIO 60948]
MTSFAGAERAPAENVIEEILDEIRVPKPVLDEARSRRELVLEIAHSHRAGREKFRSGSVAHGTENRPLEDADCGEMINRRYETFRAYGPDGKGEGPARFVETFREMIGAGVRDSYPEATATTGGQKRSIKVEFNAPVAFDDEGPVDPYVDFIVGLAMTEDSTGIWIPNLLSNSWDPGDPKRHTDLMTKTGPSGLSPFRAKVLRLAKRAVKRDGANGGVAVMCSWNLSALALECIDEVSTLGRGLERFFRYASSAIAMNLTQDPSDAITQPIKLPRGVSQAQASERLGEMATAVSRANRAYTPQAARNELRPLFGPEIETIDARAADRLGGSLRREDSARVASAIGSSYPQSGSSWRDEHGA